MNKEEQARIQRFRVVDANLGFYGFSTLQLMESVARAVFEQFQRDFKAQKQVRVLCGTGNNGGDGLAAARYLSAENRVFVHLFGHPKDLTPEAAHNLRLLQNARIPVENHKDSMEVPKDLGADVLLDCLLGSGAEGKLREPLAAAVSAFNKAKGKKVAIDLPTPGAKADYVYCIGSQKLDNCHAVLSLGVPLQFYYYTGPGDVRFLSKAKPTSRKGENGQLLVLAGSNLHHGAAIYAAKAAAQFCDLVFVLTPKQNIPLLKKASPAFIVDELTPANVAKYMKRCDAVLAGPGLHTDKAFSKELKAYLKKFKNKKWTLDASALRVLKPSDLHSNCLLTPHADEFKSVFGKKADEPALLKAARSFKGILLLKGKEDLITDGANIYRNFTGNVGMTKGGTGDILSGVCAALATTNSLKESALAGAFLTGLAGDLAFEEKGTAYAAQDVLKKLGVAYKACV